MIHQDPSWDLWLEASSFNPLESNTFSLLLQVLADSIFTFDILTSALGICGISAVVGIPLLRETYGPVVRLRRAKLAHDPEQLAITQSILLTDGKSKWEYLWINISRPIVLLCRSFICFILSLYMAL